MKASWILFVLRLPADTLADTSCNFCLISRPAGVPFSKQAERMNTDLRKTICKLRLSSNVYVAFCPEGGKFLPTQRPSASLELQVKKLSRVFSCHC